ncbi:MAG: MarR family transcriptional regulator [Deltaproteobacteria bacterium]|nr:MarR family transcriptional regulator [Deltaproteobacteria bacterium]
MKSATKAKRDAKKNTGAETSEILRSIRKIVQGLTLQSRDLYRAAGLTFPQILCLRAIGDTSKTEVTAADVARQIGVRPATVTGILDRLERDGLIVRERRSTDRRKICLALTPRGSERLETLPPSLQDRFVRRLKTLSDRDRRSIMRVLNQVVTMMEASHVDASPILTTGDLRDGSPD